MSLSVILEGSWKIQDSTGEVDVVLHEFSEETEIGEHGSFGVVIPNDTEDYLIPLGLVVPAKFFFQVEEGKTVEVKINADDVDPIEFSGISMFSAGITALYVTTPDADPEETVRIDISFAGATDE